MLLIRTVNDRVLIELKESIFVVPAFVEKKNFVKYLTHNVEGKYPFSEKNSRSIRIFFLAREAVVAYGISNILSYELAYNYTKI